VADLIAAAATAERLITANGRPVTLVLHGKDPLNSEQPWRGQAAPARAQVVGTGVFTGSSAFRSGDAGKSIGERFLLFAANEDGGHLLEEFDEVRDGAVSWGIVNAYVFNPGGTRILYEFELA